MDNPEFQLTAMYLMQELRRGAPGVQPTEEMKEMEEEAYGKHASWGLYRTCPGGQEGSADENQGGRYVPANLYGYA